MGAKEVGEKLVALCREGKNFEAIDQLYSPDIVSVEAFGSEQMPQVQKGIDAVRGKNQWWFDNNELHSGSADGPYPNGDRFAVHYRYDITAKAGPTAGQRMQFNEVALYTVKDDKIVKEEFFYSMG
jgi:ketosteroid isomerase-like protein